jgi:7-cyano-7-deazaguanine reductase
MSTTRNDLDELTVLGSRKEFSGLETFPSHSDPGDLTVTLHCSEFTCCCPLTKQPDWATIDIEYVPDGKIAESKSVKLYLETFRDRGIFHEHLAKVLCDDFVEALAPLSCTVVVHFNVRGGIAIDAEQVYTKDTL